MLLSLVTFGIVITAQPLVSEDVLEPSVQNEVDHALACVPTNLVCTVVSNAAAEARSAQLAALGLTNGLTRTQLAIRLVSSQGADGRWVRGTNDVTRAAVGLLQWCSP